MGSIAVDTLTGWQLEFAMTELEEVERAKRLSRIRRLSTAMKWFVTVILILVAVFGVLLVALLMLPVALEAAAEAPPEILTVTSPVSKPARLRLAPLAERVNLDSFYGGEGAELCVSHDGQCYLVYRRSDGGDYCVLWSSATLMPESLMLSLPDVLAAAMFDGDRGDG